MVSMLRETLIQKHPLSMLGGKEGDVLAPGEMGAILARRGVGKTALLVQIAINAMLREKNVLHVSLKEPVKKVMLWYEELFLHLAKPYGKDVSRPLLESILPHRFILTFRVEGLSIPRLEERINDLVVQGIFRPDLLIVDGLDFGENVRPTLEEMKTFARDLRVGVWFSVPIHRHLEDGRTGIPLPVLGMEDLFSRLFILTSEGRGIRIKSLLPSPADGADLILDPSSLLVNESRGVN